jgi:hypothetical protein
MGYRNNKKVSVLKEVMKSVRKFSYLVLKGKVTD